MKFPVKQTEGQGKKKATIIVDAGMKNHGDHPFFVAKAKEAKMVVEKYALPKRIKNFKEK